MEVFSIAVYAISDLHLSTNTDKSMEVFGSGWMDYMNRIKTNWLNTVSDNDTVVIGGDVSWEMKLADCESDFRFISNLPGRKIIFKGNHDYWWETVSKMNAFVKENNFNAIEFCNNNAFTADGVVICGTRWWLDPTSDEFGKDDDKVYAHELLRLENSLKSVAEQKSENILAVLHYPPFTESGEVNTDIMGLFSAYKVKKCVYGHLHGAGLKNGVEGVIGGVEYKIISADFLDFTPLKISFEKI